MKMSMMKTIFISVLAWAAVHVHAAPDFSKVEHLLLEKIDQKVFPGCAAAVMQDGKILFAQAFGNFTYGDLPAPVNGDNPRVRLDTLWDLASLTKVTTTTSCVAEFYQRGELDLDTHIADPYLLGPKYDNNGKGPIKVINLLLHNAGYPPDPVPNYNTKEFGCPATFDPVAPEVFTCSEKIFQSLLTQTLINPVGQKYVYSDLSMITAQYVVGTLAKKLGYISFEDLLDVCQGNLTDPENQPGLEKSCYYEAYARKYVFGALKMEKTGFLPKRSWWKNTAPTWIDKSYRGGTIQGSVSDGNSYALGGIAGHAGVFSNIPDLLKLMDALLAAPSGNTKYLNATTVKKFTTAYNLTQSSRALGWDTNNYKANTYRGCANLSSLTFTHLGYTGTQLCGDPTRNLATILLTNRVYPNSTGQMETIHVARQEYNNAVLDAIEGS